MRRKAPLVLMEQLVMILVFALAAALCLQTFALSNRISQVNEVREHAVLEAQNTAEVLKSCGGDCERAAAALGGQWNGSQWVRLFDESWQSVPSGETYRLCVSPAACEEALLGRADISVLSAGGECFVQLPVAWQEGGGHG